MLTFVIPTSVTHLSHSSRSPPTQPDYPQPTLCCHCMSPNFSHPYINPRHSSRSPKPSHLSWSPQPYYPPPHRKCYCYITRVAGTHNSISKHAFINIPLPKYGGYPNPSHPCKSFPPRPSLPVTPTPVSPPTSQQHHKLCLPAILFRAVII